MKVIHFEKPIVQAHRGASGYEHMNTIPAFDKAVELKADAIELDIRKTKYILSKRISLKKNQIVNGKDYLLVMK